MRAVQHIIIQNEEADQRLDRFLKRKFPALKQSQIEKICRKGEVRIDGGRCCLLYTSPSPRDKRQSRMPSSA